MGSWGHRGVGWGSSQPPKEAGVPGYSPFQALAGGQLLGLVSSPSPPFFWADPCLVPLPVLSSGRACPCPSSIPLQHWVGWQNPLFQGPQEVPLAPGDCVWVVGEGGLKGRGWNSSPGEPKTGLCLTPGATPVPIHPALLGGLLLFLPPDPPPPQPCSELHGSHPHLDSQEGA